LVKSPESTVLLRVLVFRGNGWGQLDMNVTNTNVNSQRKVLLYPGEDGYYVVEVPSLPGCISQGETREDALVNIQEAIALYIEVLQERGEAIPEDAVEVISV
jgi:predicted RNase H-like HicB family nuclease